MSGVLQLPLDLGHRPALGREDFLVAPSNEIAVAWIDRWPDWSGPALALYGPPGCGKTHLCQVWRRLSGAVVIGAATFDSMAPPELLGRARFCVLDGAGERLGGNPEHERRLLHLYNMVAEREGHLLFTGRAAPARWSASLPDLRSRLGAVTAVELERPDDALIEAVLVKLFADRQLRVGVEVIRFLITRMERSFAAARDIVAALDHASLAGRRGITVPLAREILDQHEPAPVMRDE